MSRRCIKSVSQLSSSTGEIELDLSRQTVSPADLEQLLSSDRLGDVVKLDLNEAKIEAEAVVRLLRSDRLTRLEALYLAWITIGVEGAAALAEAKSNHASLRELNLYRARLGDRGAEVVAGIEYSVLDDVNVQNNGISDAGVRAIANARWPAARIIRLGANDVWDLLGNVLSGSTTLPRGARIEIDVTPCASFYDVHEIVVGTTLR